MQVSQSGTEIVNVSGLSMPERAAVHDGPSLRTERTGPRASSKQCPPLGNAWPEGLCLQGRGLWELTSCGGGATEGPTAPRPPRVSTAAGPPHDSRHSEIQPQVRDAAGGTILNVEESKELVVEAFDNQTLLVACSICILHTSEADSPVAAAVESPSRLPSLIGNQSQTIMQMPVHPHSQSPRCTSPVQCRGNSSQSVPPPPSQTCIPNQNRLR